MTTSEDAVRAMLAAQGFGILRGGAPDFLAIKTDAHGNILEAKGVEVKFDEDKLSYEQQVYRRFFARYGIRYVVIHVSRDGKIRSTEEQSETGDHHGN